MTACPGPRALASAAAGADARAVAHAVGCERCRAIVDELGATAVALAALPGPTLAGERRAALADAVLVFAQRIGPRVDRPLRRRWIALTASAAAAAACVAILVVGRASPTPSRNVPPAPPPSQLTVVPIEPSASVRPLDGTTYEIDRNGGRETVRVHGGSGVTIEAAAAIDVEVGSARIALAPGRFEIRARGGAIASVRVFAGSAQIEHDRHVTPVFAGEIWDPPPPAAPVAPVARARQERAVPPPSMVSGTEWFRIGWLALREHREREAIAAFDRATDASIAEDAAFWAAIAAERAGAPQEALERFEQFATAFPHSERASVAAEHAARLRAAR